MSSEIDLFFLCDRIYFAKWVIMMFKKQLLNIKQNNNVVEIKINKNCDLRHFYNVITNVLGKDYYDKKIKPFDMFNFCVKRGVMYLIEKDNLVVNMYINDEEMYISEIQQMNNHIKQTTMISSADNKFSLVGATRDLQGRVLTLKSYIPDRKISGDNFYCKKEAFENVHRLLESLSKFIDTEKIYRVLNLVSKEKYNPIISDQIISLSLGNKDLIKSVKEELSQNFDIVLNETKERIGNISFNYNRNIKSEDSIGNVIYEIYDDFQNNGYATRALGLLKQFVKTVEFNGDKDLYFWIWYDNEASKKVVLNNGGEEIEEERYMEKQPYTYRIKI